MKKATIMGYAFEVDGIYYEINDDGKTVYVTSGDIEYSGEVVIPSTVTYDGTAYSVTSIGDKAFYNCSELTSVAIPESVTDIGWGAFEDCRGLTKVEISDIAAWCNIVFSDYHANPLYYSHNLYLNGELVTNLVIPESVTEIGYRAFSGCSGLTSVTIPESVTEIGYRAFYGCSGLTSVNIPESVTEVGASAFYGCSGLMSVTIPESVTKIGEKAFKGCSGLTSVTIPESVTKIGDFAFSGCSGLTKVEISDIAAWCNIVFGNGYGYANPLVYAHNLYLNGVPVTNLEIPESVTKIGKYAFSGCSGLTTVTIPESVTSIGRYAFSGCSGLTSVTIPESVTKIGVWAFAYCSGLTSVTIPESVTEIGVWAFAYCRGLTSVTIPESVTSIGRGAFAYCRGLTSETIPESVTKIGDSAFKGCTKLMSFTSLNVMPPTLPGETTFEGIPKSCQLYVPESSVMAYKTSTGWTYFSFVNGIPDSGVDAIETEALTVTVDGGAIRVDGAEGAVIEVYSLGGMLLYRGTETTIAMQSGAYLVNVAGKTQKVVL